MNAIIFAVNQWLCEKRKQLKLYHTMLEKFHHNRMTDEDWREAVRVPRWLMKLSTAYTHVELTFINLKIALYKLLIALFYKK